MLCTPAPFMPRSASVTSLTVLLATLLSGCVSYEAETNSLKQAIPQASKLTEIALGNTTSAWLLDQFGPPQAVRRPDDQTYVWQYENVSSTHKSIRALPLLAISLKDSHTTVYNFEVQNDFVVRYWAE